MRGKVVAKRSSVKLSTALVEELLAEVGARSKTEAVVIAVREQIRRRKAEKIKAMAGKMEFTAKADDLRHGYEQLG